MSPKPYFILLYIIYFLFIYSHFFVFNISLRSIVRECSVNLCVVFLSTVKKKRVTFRLLINTVSAFLSDMINLFISLSPLSPSFPFSHNISSAANFPPVVATECNHPCSVD